MGHAALDRHAEVRHIAELHGVVGFGEDGFGEVEADFARVDVEGGDEVEVGDAVTAEHGVHDAGDLVAVLRVLVVRDALHERRGAVADADDGHVDLAAWVV